MNIRKLLVLWVFIAVIVGCTELDPFEISTTSLPDGKVGESYSAWIRTTGGHGNVSIRVLSGQLPPGVSFRQEERDARLSGTPSLARDFLFTVEARDSSSSSEPDPAVVVTQGFAITVNP